MNREMNIIQGEKREDFSESERQKQIEAFVKSTGLAYNTKITFRWSHDGKPEFREGIINGLFTINNEVVAIQVFARARRPEKRDYDTLMILRTNLKIRDVKIAEK